MKTSEISEKQEKNNTNKASQFLSKYLSLEGDNNSLIIKSKIKISQIVKLNVSRGLFKPKVSSIIIKINQIKARTMFVILFFGIALAYQPEIYTNGLIKLFPKQKQNKVREVLNDTTQTLQLWLAGKAFSMLIIGLLTWIGLWILDIPLAFTLALLAALLSFIPNIGPIIAAVPAILLALLKSPIFGLYVVLLYLAIQTIESYLITPLIQQKSISLPPALIVFMQLIMSLLVGILSLALATPLLAVISVVVKQTYLNED
ncbi:AI-2E family transporter [Legionella gresilensis]|uniref:AI-2E family transporter n=1 Tax=Legionella gresilensis TaxID=91823 RepID=UPI001041B206|nr:AI-2E family transporter [Legionella gresilensis]